MIRRHFFRKDSRPRLISWALLLVASWLLFGKPCPGQQALHSADPAELALPAPGTYRLERIMPVPEGIVLNSDGKINQFSAYTTGKITVLSLIYTHCGDPNGCPMARLLLQSLKKSIEKTPRIAGSVRFVSLSFDPQNDTPDVMRLYGGSDASDQRGLQWHFLTTRSLKELRPLLAGLGQDVSEAGAGSGAVHTSVHTRILTHMLKVFLVDTHGDVREIYSSSFLVPKALLNDIQTLLLEDNQASK